MSSLLYTSASEDAALSLPPWKGVAVVRHRFDSKKSYDKMLQHYTVDLNIGTPFYLESKYSRGYRRTWMPPETLVIRPAHEATTLSWPTSIDFLTVRLEPQLLQELHAEANGRGTLEIPERYGESDPQIAYICRALWVEENADYPSGRVFGEALATALAARLLQQYGARVTAARRDGKLTPRRWAQVRDFIEDNLENDIGLEEMARVAGLSPYYFARCFKAATGTTPHQYLIARRIERARQLLANASSVSSIFSLAQVARECGFSDQSHLTRHMKRLLGVTPRALIERKNLPETQEPSSFEV